MNTLFIGRKIIRLEQTDSTNSYLISLAAKEKLPEGTVVITQKQNQGRGQRGTEWQSEEGKNLLFSILLHPQFLKPDEQFLFSKAVALGVREFIFSAIEPFSTRRGNEKMITIKWPNDIYIDDKKVAGILIENSVSGNSLQQSIAGIGINVNQEKFSDELPNPTSLKIAAGRYFDLEDCLVSICSSIEKRYLQLRSHSKEIDSDYLKNLYRFNKWSSYNYRGKRVTAKITGVSGIGKLILEKENREMLECDVKEVEFSS